MQNENLNHKKGLLALSPLILFVIVYFVSSLIAGDFYKMPITIAFMTACIYAIAVSRGKAFKQRIDSFCIGAGQKTSCLWHVYSLWPALSQIRPRQLDVLTIL